MRCKRRTEVELINEVSGTHTVKREFCLNYRLDPFLSLPDEIVLEILSRVLLSSLCCLNDDPKPPNPVVLRACVRFWGLRADAWKMALHPPLRVLAGEMYRFSVHEQAQALYQEPYLSMLDPWRHAALGKRAVRTQNFALVQKMIRSSPKMIGTLLYEALVTHNSGMARLILEHPDAALCVDANLINVTTTGSVVTNANRVAKEEILEMLLALASPGPNALRGALKTGELSICLKLLPHHRNLTARDLEAASRAGMVSVIEVMLSRSDARDVDRQPALLAAVKQDHDGIVTRLLADGRTVPSEHCVRTAAMHRCIRCLRILLLYFPDGGRSDPVEYDARVSGWLEEPRSYRR